MSRLIQLKSIKAHLEKRYDELLEKSDAYRYIDESVSDNAAYKAMKISKKLNQMNYLQTDLLQAIS